MTYTFQNQRNVQKHTNCFCLLLLLPIQRFPFLRYVPQANVTLEAARYITMTAMVKGVVRTVLERTSTTATTGNSVLGKNFVTWCTKLLVRMDDIYFQSWQLLI